MQLTIFFFVLLGLWPVLVVSPRIAYPMLLASPIVFYTFIIYSTYKLIKLYKIKADNKCLKACWRSILNYFLCFFVFLYAVLNSKSPVLPATTGIHGFGAGFEMGRHLGSITGRAIVFFLFSYLLTYSIPWIVSVFRNKEISASLLGFFISLIWLPTSIGATVMIYHQYQESKNVSYYLNKVATDKGRAFDFIQMLYKTYGFDIIELNDHSDLGNLFEKENLSLKAAKELKAALTQKLEKLTACHHWWTNQYATLSFINDTGFDELIVKHILKGEESPTIPETAQREFIAGAKKGYEERLSKMLEILEEYSVTSPWEFKVYIYIKEQ